MKEKEITVKAIESFDELQAEADQPIHCDFTLNGKAHRLNLIPVTPELSEQLREIGRRAQPPMHPISKQYDLMEPKYLEARDLNSRKARAVTVYACCPIIAAKKPGLTAVDQIYQFIKGLRLPDTLLELIEAKAMIGGLGDVERRANFTLPPSSDI